MRTKVQQTDDDRKDRTMAKEIKDVITRSADTIISDALGVVALAVMLFVGLCLPGMI
jgi:hypothetical protein